MNMNKHNINKILMTIGIGLSLVAFQTAPVFAAYNFTDPIATDTLTNGKGSNSNSSSGSSSSTSSSGTSSNTSTNTGTSSTNTPPKRISTTSNETVYLSTYDWDSIKSELSEHVHAMQSGANLSGYIPDKAISPQYVDTTTNEWVDSSGDLHSDTIKILHPRIYVHFQYAYTNNDVRENEKILRYDWKLVDGPKGAIAPTGQGKKDVWTTPGKTSTVAFYEIGKYQIQSTPFYSWDRYDELFYSMTLIQGNKTITTKNEGFLSNTCEHKTGEYSTMAELYNMTIATQDLYQTVTVHNVDTTTQYDVEINLIE